MGKGEGAYGRAEGFLQQGVLGSIPHDYNLLYRNPKSHSLDSLFSRLESRRAACWGSPPESGCGRYLFYIERDAIIRTSGVLLWYSPHKGCVEDTQGEGYASRI